MQLADRSLTQPCGIIEDVLVKVDKFIFHVDFIILDMQEDKEVPIEGSTLPVIILFSLSNMEEEKMLNILKEHKEAIGWFLADIKGIRPSMCMHMILLEEDSKWTVDSQRRLNISMKEVVQKGVLKW